jgi:hypothetical protein
MSDFQAERKVREVMVEAQLVSRTRIHRNVREQGCMLADRCVTSDTHMGYFDKGLSGFARVCRTLILSTLQHAKAHYLGMTELLQLA